MIDVSDATFRIIKSHIKDQIMLPNMWPQNDRQQRDGNIIKNNVRKEGEEKEVDCRF